MLALGLTTGQRQRAVQGETGGRAVCGTRFKHGGDVERLRTQTQSDPRVHARKGGNVNAPATLSYHPVCGESSLQEAREDVRGMMAVVRDPAESGVHG